MEETFGIVFVLGLLVLIGAAVPLDDRPEHSGEFGVGWVWVGGSIFI